MVGLRRHIHIGTCESRGDTDGRIVPILGTVPIGIGMMGFFVLSSFGVRFDGSYRHLFMSSRHLVSMLPAQSLHCTALYFPILTL
jgi:hypothetical protein